MLWYIIKNGFYYVELGSFYAHFLESFFFFNHKWVFNFVQSFSASIEIMIPFLFFSLLMWCTIDLCIWKKPYILGINPSWPWYMILLIYCWIQFASILFEDFCVCANQWYWHVIFFSFFFLVSLSVFFWCLCLISLSVKVMAASQNELGSVPSSAIFWNSLRKIGFLFS